MDTREELLTAFDIGPDDLAANRQGRLGPRQLRALRRRARRRTGGWVAGAVVAAAGIAAAVVPLWTKLTVAVVAGAFVAATVLRAARQVRRAGQPGAVGRLSGQVTPMLLFRENAGWWLAVQGRTFRAPLDVAQLAQFDEDTLYHVYHLRRAHRVVALEAIAVDASRTEQEIDSVPEETVVTED